MLLCVHGRPPPVRVFVYIKICIKSCAGEMYVCTRMCTKVCMVKGTMLWRRNSTIQGLVWDWIERAHRWDWIASHVPMDVSVANVHMAYVGYLSTRSFLSQHGSANVVCYIIERYSFRRYS